MELSQIIQALNLTINPKKQTDIKEGENILELV